MIYFRKYEIIIKYTKGATDMSKVCQLSGKGPMSGNNRSHSLRATRRKWNANLQTKTFIIDGKPTKLKVSTRALRTLKKNANVAA